MIDIPKASCKNHAHPVSYAVLGHNLNKISQDDFQVTIGTESSKLTLVAQQRSNLADGEAPRLIFIFF